MGQALKTEFQLEAHAKVNLALEVLGLLEGGYHELDTVFCNLELADRLHWQSADRLELEVVGDVSGLDIPTGEENLVMRAVRVLEERVGRPLPGRIRLEKRIPAGGGLGGGSADAGALLAGLNQHLELGLGQHELVSLGGRLGADVAFCALGGTARGRERGDRLNALPQAPPLGVVLVFPPFGCPTGAVYRHWDARRFRPAAGCAERMAAALETGSAEALLAALGNDLEPAALELRPELASLRQAMGAAGCDGVLLAGSGSTLFGLVVDDERLMPVAERLRVLLRQQARVLVSRLRG